MSAVTRTWCGVLCLSQLVTQKKKTKKNNNNLCGSDMLIGACDRSDVAPGSRLHTGIELIEHQIYGGLYAQMLTGESFEEVGNSTTGISAQWAVGGTGARPGVTHNITSVPGRGGAAAAPGVVAPINGLQYLAMGGTAATVSHSKLWAENRGLGFAGMTFVQGRPYEGWLLAGAVGAATAVTVELRCGSNASYDTTRALATTPTLALTECDPTSPWQLVNFTVTPSRGCVGEGALVIAVAPLAPAVRLDMAYLQPGDWGRYKGLPVRKDLAEYLVGSGIKGMRMGGGSINAAAQTPANSSVGSGYVLANFRGPRIHRQPLMGEEYPVCSAGWGWVDFANFCEAANLTAAITLNERDDPVAVVEYLFGSADTTDGGALRAADGHPAPYARDRILLEIGNERMPGSNPACPGNDCVAAFFSFAAAAQNRATELNLGKLRLVVCLYAWGLFDPANAIQKSIVRTL